MKIFKYLLPVIIGFFFGCSLEEPSKTETTLNLGNTDFSRYVAIGNSLTAGYQSGALTESRQLKSYPMQIATQAGVSASFVQPLLGYPGIGSYSKDATNPAGILELTYLDNPNTPNTVSPDPVITPEPFADHVGTFNPLMPWADASIRDYPAPYNNLGIPGSVTYEMLNSYDAASSLSANSFFDIILRNPNLGNTTVVQQASGLGAGAPTFITCWIGNNDVLGFALSGGTVPITGGALFANLYTQLMDALQALGADVVVANIPDVTAIPFFNTIPPYLINPETNDLLLVGGNPVPIIGVNPGDLVLLSATAALAQGLGVPAAAGGTDAALPDAYVLDASEVAEANAAIANFNASIASIAVARNIPVVDFNSFFNDLKANGYNFGGVEFTTEFLTGNFFSLDGVHPSSIGYSIVANQFIQVINDQFDATIPLINITDELGKQSEIAGKVKYHPDAFNNVVKMFAGK